MPERVAGNPHTFLNKFSIVFCMKRGELSQEALVTYILVFAFFVGAIIFLGMLFGWFG